MDGLGSRRHVGSFGYRYHAVCDKCPGVIAVNLVLCRRWKCYISLLTPWTCILDILASVLVGILLDASTTHVLELHDEVELLAVNAVGVIYVAVGVAHSDDLAAKLDDFLHSVLCDISRARNKTCLALDCLSTCAEHLLKEIYVAVSCSLGTYERTAELETLACEYAVELACQFLVHAEHVAYLTAAYADVTCRNVHLGAYVTPQLCDECLAETHYLVVALAFGVKVGATLGTTHGQGGQRVFECLFKREVLEYAHVYRGVEADAPLVWSDSVVVLDAVAGIYLYLAVVIDPCDTESENSVGDTEPLNKVVRFKFGMLVILFFNGVQYLLYGLIILWLVGESSF